MCKQHCFSYLCDLIKTFGIWICLCSFLIAGLYNTTRPSCLGRALEGALLNLWGGRWSHVDHHLLPGPTTMTPAPLPNQCPATNHWTARSGSVSLPQTENLTSLWCMSQRKWERWSRTSPQSQSYTCVSRCASQLYHPSLWEFFWFTREWKWTPPTLLQLRVSFWVLYVLSFWFQRGWFSAPITGTQISLLFFCFAGPTQPPFPASSQNLKLCVYPSHVILCQSLCSSSAFSPAFSNPVLTVSH